MTIHDLRQQLNAWLDERKVTRKNIGEIRTHLMMPWDSEWNGIVQEETAAREVVEKNEMTPDEVLALLPSYMIDHCEGEVVTEEAIQHWTAEMLQNKEWLARAGKIWVNSAYRRRAIEALAMNDFAPAEIKPMEEPKPGLYETLQALRLRLNPSGIIDPPKEMIAAYGMAGDAIALYEKRDAR